MNDGGRLAMEEQRDRRHAVDLHIEELVLDGFNPGDRHRIGAAVEAELARLFAERGVSPSLAWGAELATLDGGSFDVAPGAGPEQVGGQVAQAVYGGLNR
jgi:hypothetical protein